MIEEKLIKNAITVFTAIIHATGDRQFKIVPGGKNLKSISKLLEMIQDEYGDVSTMRLTDFCICSAYYFFNSNYQWNIQQAFGKTIFSRFRDGKYNKRHYEDKWLEKSNITRNELYKLIADKSEHPQAKYIYVPSEEFTKRRLLNSETGYGICQISTLGWSPLSETCGQCEFVDKCKKATEAKYPELYRIRIEHGSKKQCID